MIFFHFSGFDIAQLNAISKHQNRHSFLEHKSFYEYYANKVLVQKARLAKFDTRYKYSLWWHKHVKHYRAVSDLFWHPRRSR